MDLCFPSNSVNQTPDSYREDKGKSKAFIAAGRVERWLTVSSFIYPLGSAPLKVMRKGETPDEPIKEEREVRRRNENDRPNQNR